MGDHKIENMDGGKANSMRVPAWGEERNENEGGGSRGHRLPRRPRQSPNHSGDCFAKNQLAMTGNFLHSEAKQSAGVFYWNRGFSRIPGPELTLRARLKPRLQDSS